MEPTVSALPYQCSDLSDLSKAKAMPYQCHDLIGSFLWSLGPEPYSTCVVIL